MLPGEKKIFAVTLVAEANKLGGRTMEMCVSEACAMVLRLRVARRSKLLSQRDRRMLDEFLEKEKS